MFLEIIRWYTLYISAFVALGSNRVQTVRNSRVREWLSSNYPMDMHDVVLLHPVDLKTKNLQNAQ